MLVPSLAKSASCCEMGMPPVMATLLGSVVSATFAAD